MNERLAKVFTGVSCSSSSSLSSLPLSLEAPVTSFSSYILLICLALPPLLPINATTTLLPAPLLSPVFCSFYLPFLLSLSSVFLPLSTLQLSVPSPHSLFLLSFLIYLLSFASPSWQSEVKHSFTSPHTHLLYFPHLDDSISCFFPWMISITSNALHI